jgi:alcohol dehydrogenase
MCSHSPMRPSAQAASDPLATEIRKFVAPEIVAGLGAMALAGRYARNLGVRRALLVSDGQVVASGWPARVADALRAAGVEQTPFHGISPNPRTTEVMQGAEAYRSAGCDGLVVVGGGSPMDAAKAIGIVVSNGGEVQQFEGVDRIEVPIPPLVCVPTTAGSAADVSQFAILSDHAKRLKFGIISKALIPDVSLVDPEPLTTMPPEITAGTGMDALSHAMEAYASNAASPLTDLLALEAVRLVATGLRRSMDAPRDLAARAQMARASMLAGLAFSNAILGVVHAIAHAVGGLRDVAHGHCNALLLEHAVRFNFPSAPERYRALAEAMGASTAGLPDPAACDALTSAIRRLRHQVGFESSLGGLGVQRSDIPDLARVALGDPCMATNPRVPAPGELESLLEQAL